MNEKYFQNLDNLPKTYKESLGFLRDIFNYMIPGIIFIFLCKILFYEFAKNFINQHSINVFTNSKLINSILLVFICYVLGRFINSLGSFYFPLFDKLRGLVPGKLYKEQALVKSQLVEISNNYITQNKLTQGFSKIEQKKDLLNNIINSVQLNQLFNNYSSLYYNKLERYNTHLMFSKSMSSVFLLVIIFSISIPIPIKSFLFFPIATLIFLTYCRQYYMNSLSYSKIKLSLLIYMDIEK